MINKKDRKLFELSENSKDFSKFVHSWLAQYEEEDDFLSGKVSNSISEFAEEE